MRRPLEREDGVALPVVMMVLFLVSMIAATAAASSVRLSDTSTEDSNSKRALAAAEAGLQAATYRTNKLPPGDTNGQCVTTTAVAPNAAGECPGLTQDLGNGASYTYYVTPVSSGPCAGLQLVSPDNTITQRCVTSTGEVNGVRRRAQARVATYLGAPIFPAGIIGLSGVTFNNSVQVTGDIGSNGPITLGNSTSITGGLELGPSAPQPSTGNPSVVSGGVTRRDLAQGDFVLAPVEVGNSATVNDNSRITTGLDASKNIAWNSLTRELTLKNSSTLTLGGGTYNFCNLNLTNSAYVTIAATAGTRIFIDSPDRPGSGCAPGTGNLTVGNSAGFITPSGRAEDLQIYVYGKNDGTNVVNFENSNTFTGTLYAPQSSVVFKNSTEIVGAIAGKKVEFKNSVDFTYPASLAELRATTARFYYRTAWRECRPSATVSSDPESGCG